MKSWAWQSFKVPSLFTIGVVPFCSLPVLATPQKNHLFGPSRALIKWKVHFLVASHKNIVAKDVGKWGYAEPAKYGAKIRMFAFSKAKIPAQFP
jgi:hypothetical protein